MASVEHRSQPVRNPLQEMKNCFFTLLLLFSGTLLPASQPNIIFIMADDLGYGDLGCYGLKLIKTPRIDSLAEQGVRFTQAYAGGPVCASSRSVLMTGLHNGHTPARDNVPHYHTYLKEDDITVAERLKHAGYRTGGVGKWRLLSSTEPLLAAVISPSLLRGFFFRIGSRAVAQMPLRATSRKQGYAWRVLAPGSLGVLDIWRTSK